MDSKELYGVIIMAEQEEKDDINIYSTDDLELLLESDELSPEEEAFMTGYDNAA